MEVKKRLKIFLFLFVLAGFIYPSNALAYPGDPCTNNTQCSANEVCLPVEPTETPDEGSGGESVAVCTVVASGGPATGSATEGGAETGPRVAATLDNPLGDPDMKIPEVIGRVIKVLLGVLGSLALFVFCYGASNWITSAGYPQRVEEGTKTMLFAVAGMFVIFAAYAILNALLRVLEVSQV